MSESKLNLILYAEDEPDIREIAKIALEEIGGFTVKYCINGKDVISNIKQFKPDLLLLDVMMPDMDGPMTLQAVRQIPGYEGIPVIFMTAKIQKNEIDEYKKIGAVDVIGKPFDPLSLADDIRKIWAKYKETT